ncbi:unnamed protein product [Phytophthora fragariaefolia]|uniref:Unnamed protein product n=1 Tax=Phytophthora fragariaefolia TaxID=1490495 RepID=A0A9W6WSJ0_9STRA|nr:unnamed protein product [Phytophthora fragariaefolia]
MRLDSDKYNEWRDLAYYRSRDSNLYKDEGAIYQRWLAAQPSAVERVSYTTDTKFLKRPSDSSEGSESGGDGRTECATSTTEPLTEVEAAVAYHGELRPTLAECSSLTSESSESTQLKLEGAYLAAATVSET